VEHGDKIGIATNNVAEYTALIRALEKAAELGLRRPAIFSDSELMVKQFNGEYSVKNADLKDLYDEARALARRFDSVTLSHVRRADNKRADQLCNTVLDGQPPVARAASSPGPKSRSKGRPPRNAGVDWQAIACLRSALTAKPPPAPEQLWDQLWSVLEESGLLKTKRAK
jgi:ribonuclease HI